MPQSVPLGYIEGDATTDFEAAFASGVRPHPDFELATREPSSSASPVSTRTNPHVAGKKTEDARSPPAHQKFRSLF